MPVRTTKSVSSTISRQANNSWPFINYTTHVAVVVKITQSIIPSLAEAEIFSTKQWKAKIKMCPGYQLHA